MSLALASMLVASGVASAQEMADTTKVNVAFGQVAKADLMGGVSEVNVEELLKKDYSANALNDLQSLISGYNGNVWGQGALVLVDGAPVRPAPSMPPRWRRLPCSRALLP